MHQVDGRSIRQLVKKSEKREGRSCKGEEEERERRKGEGRAREREEQGEGESRAGF